MQIYKIPKIFNFVCFVCSNSVYSDRARDGLQLFYPFVKHGSAAFGMEQFDEQAGTHYAQVVVVQVGQVSDV